MSIELPVHRAAPPPGAVGFAQRFALAPPQRAGSQLSISPTTVEFAVALAVILFNAAFFTNAVEMVFVLGAVLAAA